MRFIIVTYEAAQTFTSRSELLAYSLIATCTQDGCGNWHGGYKALADAIGVTKANAIKAVNNLIEKGYVKSEPAVLDGRAVSVLTAIKACGIETIPEYQNNTARGIETIPREVSQQYPITSNNNIITNNSVNNNARTRGFQAPTVDEVREYCEARNNGIDAEQFVAFYAARGWKFSNGAPVKDWKSCVITWEKRDNNRAIYQPYQQPKREGFAEANARVLAQIDQMF